MSFEDEYRELMAKPIDEIKEDIFFRADNFGDEPWYDDLQRKQGGNPCFSLYDRNSLIKFLPITYNKETKKKES